MIHLSLPDGTPVAVNPFHVFAIEPRGQGCLITASGGATIQVGETMMQVQKLVKRWTKDGAE